MKDLFLKNKLLLFAVVMFLIAVISFFTRPSSQMGEPPLPAPFSPFKNSVAGIGTIEPSSENINLGTSLPGIVTKIYVTVGQNVRKDDSLFTIDDRDTKAQLELAQAKLKSAQAAYTDKQNQLALYEGVSDKRAISKDDLTRRRDAAQIASAEVQEAQANVKVLQTTLDRLTVKSPIDGTILKVNVRQGEYAQGGGSKALMTVGKIDPMHVRVEIDETDAARINPNSKAVGLMRGNPNKEIPLVFVRFEPLLIPKSSLANTGNEVIDTRILQIIYAFDNKNLGAYAGQQMDVFIQAEPLKKNKTKG
jgi:RND family efflux transporter MFP subunit